MQNENSKNAVEVIQKKLFDLQDLEYKAFHSKLIPTIDPDSIIGVRTPALRKLTGEIAKMAEAEIFLQNLPHKYYEENNLHAFLLETIKDYDECVAAVCAFLPYVDNWATCDMMSPKVFKKHLPQLLDCIKIWTASDLTYTVRFGIGMLMKFYLDETFDLVYPEMVASIRSEEYYVNMMIAWYFATALAKQYDSVLPFLEERRLDQWTHNKAIQKAVESNRITKEQKEYLKSLKIR